MEKENVYVINCLEERDGCAETLIDGTFDNLATAQERLKVLKCIELQNMKSSGYKPEDFDVIDNSLSFGVFNNMTLDKNYYEIIERKVQSTFNTIQNLTEIVTQCGEVKTKNTGEKFVELDICECGFSWTYWDDNETEYTDDNGYIKVAQSLRLENDVLKVVWDGGYKECLTNLNYEEDVSGMNCTETLYDYVIEWLLQ